MKTLLSNAIAALSTALLATLTDSAQAQTSVTLYGLADGGLRFDKTNIGTLRSVSSGAMGGSRFGIRGTEDLGGGLKANFVLEQGFDLSDNSVPQGNVGFGASLGQGAIGANSSPRSSSGGRFFSRTATVGLSGPFGEIRFGRAYNPLLLVQLAADPFFLGGGSPNTLLVNNTYRNDNAVYYDTPRVGGVQGSLMYQLGESTTNNTAPVAGGQARRGNDQFGASVTYANGPLYVGAGYQQIRSVFDNFRVRTGDLAATYDFGVVKLHALYWRTKNSNGNTNPAFGSTVALNSRTIWGGISVPFGAWTFLGGYGRLTDKSTSNVGANLGNPKADFFSLGAKYSLSKRTFLYASSGRMKLTRGPSGNPFQGLVGIIDANSAGLYTPANLVNVNPTSYWLGVNHSF